jgi:flagellar biosynthesis activator protein FlaF
MSAAESNDNPQPIEVRQNILNIATFVLHRTLEVQNNPTAEKIQSLIDINSNIAAGLSGRG